MTDNKTALLYSAAPYRASTDSPHPMAPSRIHRVLVPLLLVAGPLAFALLSVYLGQDAGWDLRNYHYYNPWAWLTGRLEFDVAPAHVATFYNPTLYFPYYGLVQVLPAMGVAAVIGAVQGLNLLLVYLVARQVLVNTSPFEHPLWALAVAVTGVLGAAMLSEVGTLFSDNLLSLLILSALALVLGGLKGAAVSPGFLRLALAGLLAGFAFGLKQPMVLYCVGLCAACFALPGHFWRRFNSAFVFGLGVLAGFAVTGGWWAWHLWSRFGNPLFPYYNQIFKSPWAQPEPYNDPRFLPQSLGEAVQLLFAPFNAPTEIGEVGFRDPRLPMLVLLAVAALLALAIRRRADISRAGGYLLAMLGVTLLVWLKLFAIYRYVLPVELLAPAAIVLLTGALTAIASIRSALAILFLTLCLMLTQPGNWGRAPWGPDPFGVELPPVAEDGMVLMTGYEPMTYIIPALPPRVPVLRIQSYFTGPSDRPHAYDRLMQKRIAGHQGPLYLIYRSYEPWAAEQALTAYGLRMGSCTAFVPAMDRWIEGEFLLCRLQPDESGTRSTQ